MPRKSPVFSFWHFLFGKVSAAAVKQNLEPSKAAQLPNRLPYLSSFLIIPAFFLLSLSSCGEFIGTDDFASPEIGDVLKIESYFTEDNYVKFLNTASKPEEDFVPCRTVIGGENCDAYMRVRGYTSRTEPKKNYTLRLIDSSGEEVPFALMTEAGTWMKNRIVMYAYNNYKYKGKSLTAAPETEASALFVNDEYIGYYSKVDIYTQEELESYKKGSISELFKVHLLSYSESPLYSQSEKKFPEDDDFSSLETLIYNVMTMSDSVWEAWVLNYIDIDDFVRYMVVHDFFGVTDTTIQNYYIYNYGKMLILPWDNELGMNIDFSDFYGHNRLTERILEIASVKAEYEAEMKKFAVSVNPSDPDYDPYYPSLLNSMKNKINEWYSASYNAVKNDPLFLYDINDFTDMKDYILNFIDNRPAEIAKYIP